MTVSLKHAFTSPKADGTDPTNVNPSNWNAEHALTCASGKVLGRSSAGTGAVEEISTTLAVPTYQSFLTNGSGTYNTPVGCRQLRIRMWAGGGGGSGWNGATNGGSGGDSNFGSTTTKGGSGGTTGGASIGNGGAGGVGGVNTGATSPIRITGGQGQQGYFNCGSAGQGPLAAGGCTAFFGPNFNGTNFGYGTGGLGGTGFAASAAGSATAGGGGGGGGGEYVEFVINAPAASYSYTVGGSGAASVSGSINGSPGQNGAIIVEEIY